MNNSENAVLFNKLPMFLCEAAPEVKLRVLGWNKNLPSNYKMLPLWGAVISCL